MAAGLGTRRATMQVAGYTDAGGVNHVVLMIPAFALQQTEIVEGQRMRLLYLKPDEIPLITTAMIETAKEMTAQA